MLGRRSDKALEIYHELLAQARSPRFFGPTMVPDTVEGRFEVLILHVFLVVDALGARPGGEALGQDVFDAFFSDMDDALREMGVGDLSVAKKIKAMSEAFYGRSLAYREALSEAAEPSALGRALERNLFALQPVDQTAIDLMAAYIRQTVDALAPLRAKSGPLRLTFPTFAE